MDKASKIKGTWHYRYGKPQEYSDSDVEIGGTHYWGEAGIQISEGKETYAIEVWLFDAEELTTYSGFLVTPNLDESIKLSLLPLVTNYPGDVTEATASAKMTLISKNITLEIIVANVKLTENKLFIDRIDIDYEITVISDAETKENLYMGKINPWRKNNKKYLSKFRYFLVSRGLPLLFALATTIAILILVQMLTRRNAQRYVFPESTDQIVASAPGNWLCHYKNESSNVWHTCDPVIVTEKEK